MATQTKVIGPISAYAIAVQEGYTGSKAEWAEAIGNAQENAQIAQEAADRAQSLTESLPQDFTDTVANFAPEYSPSGTYSVGDYVIHNGLLYRCTTAITSGEAWTSGHWTQVNVGGELENKADEIGDIKSDVDDMIVTTIGNNLTNPEEVYNAIIINETGVIIPGNNYYECSGKIPVTPGETLYILWKVADNDIRVRKTSNDKVAFYKADDTFISIGYNEDSYAVPPLAAYCVEQAAQHVMANGTVALFKTNAPDVNNRWESYIETKTIKESYIPDEVVDNLNDLNDNAMLARDYLDYSMVNRLDPEECEIGFIDINSGGVNSGNTNYFTTDFMEIRTNETLYFMDIRGTLSNAKRVVAFDSTKTVIRSECIDTDTQSFLQKNDVAYIRVSFPYASSDIYRTPQGKVCLPVNNPIYVPGYGQEPPIKSEHIRPFIRVYATDTESQIITKFVTAFNIGNCDIWFDRSAYTFGTELEKISTDYGMPHNEIPIGNGCRYYFNGSTLTATVDLSQHPSAEGADEFYCNFFGCQRRPSSYEMHDGVLIATDTRYVVHDESSGLSQTYRHLYQNMEMHYHTSARQEAIRKCIGGGTGEHGVVEIVGCKFTTDASDSCVSFHGNSNDVAGAEFDLNIRDSWFSNGVRAGALSTNQTARLFYTGNSAIANPTTYDRWTVTAFLNEIRS